MSDDPTLAPAVVLADAIRRGRTTSRELVERHLERIERLNGDLNAIVTLDADGARAAADRADASGGGGPLHGVPITLKDCFATAGMRTTAGMQDLADHVPDADAEAVRRLRAVGAIVLGKTNLPEGVSGQETANELFGRTANPWALDRTPGGSSGGAAAAIAAGLSALELGSDSGGSIRQPAHCCGVYGHLPSHGLVPATGHLPSVPLDDVGASDDLLAVGPLARSADDLAVALDVLAGPYEVGLRAWRLELPPPRATSLHDLRVALWVDDPACPASAEVRVALESAGQALAGAGALVDDARRPGFGLAEAFEVAFRLWVASNASAGPAERRKYAEAVATLHPDDRSLAAERARTMVLPHAEWLALDTERRRLERAWAALFDDVDVVLCPVSPVVAPAHDDRPEDVDELDHRLARTIDVDGRQRPYLDQIVWNTVVGMCRLPATVAPMPSPGMPVGAQLVGPRYGDRTTIEAARLLADVVGGYRPPPLGAPG